MPLPTLLCPTLVHLWSESIPYHPGTLRGNIQRDIRDWLAANSLERDSLSANHEWSQCIFSSFSHFLELSLLELFKHQASIWHLCDSMIEAQFIEMGKSWSPFQGAPGLQTPMYSAENADRQVERWVNRGPHSKEPQAYRHPCTVLRMLTGKGKDVLASLSIQCLAKYLILNK